MPIALKKTIFPENNKLTQNNCIVSEADLPQEWVEALHPSNLSTTHMKNFSIHT